MSREGRASHVASGLSQSIVDAMRDGVVLVDDTGTIIGVNPAMAALTGFPTGDLVGAANPHPYFPDDDPTAQGFLDRLVRGEYNEAEVGLRRPDGTDWTALVTPGFFSDNGTRRCFFTVKDITENQLADEELSRSRANFRQVMDTIPQRLFWKDREFRYLGCNRVFAQDAGLNSPEQIVGLNDFQLSWKETASLYRADDHEVMETDISKINYEEPQVRADGSRLWLRTSKIPLKDDKGDVVGVFGSYEDITEKKMAEEAVRRSEEKYRNLIQQAIDGIFLTRADGTIIEANTAGRKMLGFGRDEIVGTNIRDLIPEETLASNPIKLPELQTGNVVTNERLFRRRDGSTIAVEVTAKQLVDGNLIGVVRDISERKAAEEQRRQLETRVRQSHKMEALGTLAGGISHDFNNILLAISGYAELVRDTFTEDDARHSDLVQLMKAANRGRQLVKQILTFSHPGEPTLHYVGLDDVITDMMPLIHASVPAGIEFNVLVEPSAGVVAGDEGQINQLVLNLVANATHAMRDAGGTLDVTLDTFDLGMRMSHRQGELAPGRYFRLCVSDTGKGIEPEHIERVFDPFFTTKGVGEGAGMGLSVVHGIAQNMGAAIDITTGARGTKFTVYFPWQRDRGGRMPESASVQPQPVGGDERVLLVDDEESIAEIGSRMLGMLGYRVTAYSDPARALEAFRAAPRDFDVVVTDFAMPRMSGVDFAREVLSERPDVVIVMMTGYSDGLTKEVAVSHGLKGFISKPYTRDELARAVRDALTRTAG